jgi:hypothetical protein
MAESAVHVERAGALRLVVQTRDTAGDVASDARTLPILEVANGPSYVVLDDAGAEPCVRLLTQRPHEAPVVALEPVRFERRAALLVTTEGVADVRRNGGPSPRLSLLRPGDVLQLGPVLLHVREQRRPEIVAAEGAWLEQTCATCCTPILPGSTIAVCPSCGLGHHLEPPPNSQGEPLDCAKLRRCSCGASLSIDEEDTPPEDEEL